MNKTQPTASAPIQVHIRLDHSTVRTGWKAAITYDGGGTAQKWLVSYLPHNLTEEQMRVVINSYLFDLGCDDGNIVIGSDGVNFTATWQGGQATH